METLDLGESGAGSLQFGCIAARQLKTLHQQRLLHQIRQELVERRIEEPDGDGKPLHCGEDALEVGLLHRQDLIERIRPGLVGFRQDHAADRRQPVSSHEHVLGATQPDALGTQFTSLGCVLEVVGVRAHPEFTDLVGPRDHALEVLVDARRDQLDLLREHITRGTVEGDDLTLLDDPVADGECAAFGVDVDAGGTCNARLAHATRYHCSMGGHASVGGEHTLGDDHAVDVIGGGFVAHQHHCFTTPAALGGGVGIEDHLADRSPRGRGEALRDGFLAM